MDLKPYLKMIGAVAPTLAAAIGGPLASTAVGAVVNALGIGPDAQDQIEATLAAGSPDTLAKLKIAEEDFKVKMKQLDIDLERINASDRDSARNREAAVRDKTPMIYRERGASCYAWFTRNRMDGNAVLLFWLIGRVK